MRKKRKYTAQEQKERVRRILLGLNRGYAGATCALDHRSALELLIATILSAQCTDERVNLVTRDLFRKYADPEDYVKVSPAELETDIRSTGFFRNKAKSIRGACRKIIDDFGGRVPHSMEELIQLPGVARKTANVVLGVAFGKSEGIVVDTHVFRISHRLELTGADTPEKVERDLMELIPRERWIDFSHQMIHHGRKLCRARKPACFGCPLESVCNSKDKTPGFPPVQAPPGSEAHSRGRRS